MLGWSRARPGGARERALRRQCRSLLRELDIRPPLDVHELCRRLGEKRGRPIELHAYPIAVPGPFGLWFGLPDRDAIFYQKETTPAHQNHIIAHELGHILADHPSDENDQDEAATAVRNDFPGNDSGDGPRARRRTCYDSDYEREAEVIATILLEWSAVVDYVVPRPADSVAARRLQAALGDRQGWL